MRLGQAPERAVAIALHTGGDGKRCTDTKRFRRESRNRRSKRNVARIARPEKAALRNTTRAAIALKSDSPNGSFLLVPDDISPSPDPDLSRLGNGRKKDRRK
jgi:hypothetical protein